MFVFDLGNTPAKRIGIVLGAITIGLVVLFGRRCAEATPVTAAVCQCPPVPACPVDETPVPEADPEPQQQQVPVQHLYGILVVPAFTVNAGTYKDTQTYTPGAMSCLKVATDMEKAVAECTKDALTDHPSWTGIQASPQRIDRSAINYWASSTPE